MIDIDKFKDVNDTYGHVVGDEVIRHISGLIRHHVRETDVSGRYGGEEFVILLADTPGESGKVFAERLRAEIEEAVVKYNDIDLKYTVSMGIAEIDNSIESYETWIEFADSAMYRAKDAGRNQVMMHQKS
jgi:diguanylate cyclase (GGDEF)-like protein